MGKQLRLDVAQLTDVGRKRDHNEDNMAYVIPKDPQVMSKKGALFIVADGMGGHAAGEVASEIAVDTVSSIYYQDGNDDVAASLLSAIKRANTSIHQRAAENMSRSGMGTTCVAAVLRGNVAYIANVGDSRAYLVSGGQVRQVSQDHSWVAEQVRAGLLTEEQARTHAQRNVITRSLGTQPDVEVDVFSEQLEEDDSLILCTDGLSGLISDADLQRIVAQFVPQESVYHLVERANENGGPDNITAIVVHVQEVGFEPPNGRRLVHVGRRETSEDGVPTEVMTSSIPFPAPPGKSRSGPLSVSSGPLSPADLDTAPQPVVKVPSRRRSRLLYPTIALLVLVVIVLVGGGSYYFFFLQQGSGPTTVKVTQTIQQAQKLITQAKSEVATTPTTALHDLASAQSKLLSLPSAQLSTAQNTQVTQLLQGDLTITTRSAIQSYNHHANISVLPCAAAPAASSATTINDVSTGTQAQRLTVVQDATGTNFFYAIGKDKNLYQLTKLNSLVGPLTLPGKPQVLDLSSNGSQLSVLMYSPSANSYTFGFLAPGQTSLKATTLINPKMLATGQTPILLTVQGTEVYVLTSSALAANGSQTAQIAEYAFDAKGMLPKGSPKLLTVLVSGHIVALAAFPGHLLFLLLDSGAVESLQLGSSTSPSPIPVQVRPPLPFPLAVSASAFTPTTPVPTVSAPVAATGTSQLGVDGSGSLAASVVGGIAQLSIADPASHRVLTLILTPTGGGVAGGSEITLQVVQQYVSLEQLAHPQSVTENAKGVVSVLEPASASVVSLVSINTSVQTSGKCT